VAKYGPISSTQSWDFASGELFKKDYTNFQTINGMKKLNGETVNMRGVKVEAPVGTPVEIYSQLVV